MSFNKKFISCLLVIFMITFFTGCDRNHQKVTLSNISKIYSLSSVQCDANKYILDLPEDWTCLDTSFSPDAILSCGNLKNDQYLMMIADSKSDVTVDFTEYTSMVLHQVATTLDNAVIQQTSNLKISDYEGTVTAIIGTLNQIKVQYWVYTVDCANDYLQIITAALQEKAGQTQLTYDHIIQSLKTSDITK